MRHKRIILAAICAASLSASIGLMGLAPASAATAARTGAVARTVPLAKPVLRAAKPALKARPDFTKGAEYYISTLSSNKTDYYINAGITGSQLYLADNELQIWTVESTAKVVDGNGFYMWSNGNGDCMEFNDSAHNVRTATCDSSVTAQWWWLDGSIAGGGVFYSLYGFESGAYYTMYANSISNQAGVLCNDNGRYFSVYFS